MKKMLYAITLVISGLVIMGNVEAKIVETDLKEVVEEEINYFDNKSNFESEQSFDAYQQYVNLLKNANLSNYTESNDKVNVYIFRGYSCWHCLDEISWIASKTEEYGQYFNIRTFEVWDNKDNSKLMNTVAKQLGESVSGVPYTIIGKQTYSGFSEELGEQMLEQVKKLYESNDRYDIKDVVNLEDGSLVNGEEKKSSTTVTIVLIAIVIIAGIALVYYVSKSK